MGLKEFEFISESIEMLKVMTPTLGMMSDEIGNYFEDILEVKNQEYINITSRVKSESSLREKIIRNRYLKKYNEAKHLIHNLSDLIGVRIECRFIEDEGKIYRILKKYFNKTDDKIFYYNKENPNIKLRLSEKQPQKQKNGFEIYKIDGKIEYLDRQLKFELQIKSLVNIFWSEIEHKVIYKNNTYLLADGFLQDMMTSIKNNLTMIDKQLLSIYKTFETGSLSGDEERKRALEKLLAKIAYDTFSTKMKDSMGFVVDFKKPCETILSYSINKKQQSVEQFGDIMIQELENLNNIAKQDIDFTQPILLENNPSFNDEFCKKLGSYTQGKLNDEFAWNLFFRILFEIEPYNNKKDFENFIVFIRDKVISVESNIHLMSKFGIDSKVVIKDIYNIISEAFIKADTVEILYDYNLEKVNFLSNDILTYICREIDTLEEYESEKEEILERLYNKILQLFE